MRWAAVLLVLIVSGCAPVKPWQKGHLANPVMQFEPDPLVGKLRRHMYESKEGSSGGYGVGGCG
jgi:hypothetical protein